MGKPPLSPMAGSTASRHSSSVSLFAQQPSSSSRLAVPAGQQPPAPAATPQTAAPAGPAHPSGFAGAAAAAAAAAAQGVKDASAAPAPAVPLLPAMHSAPAALGSDCASDDGSLSPESSLCSSASSSSLCSYGSLASSTCSAGSRPRSILVRRSVSSSGASSPRGTAPKNVRWRDGESVREDAGSDLVAVLVLHDTPEIRRLRKDTWPERSKGRDVRELTVTVPIRVGGAGGGSSGSASQQQQQAQAGGADCSAAAAAAANPLVATVKDWKEKLRALSAERRAQRVAEMQDTWAARQEAQQRQLLQRQQREQAAAAAAAAAAGAAAATAAALVAEGSSPAGAAAALEVDTVKAAASAGPAAGGPVITLQAVAGNLPQPVC